MDLEMFVFVVRAALEASLRKFDVLQFMSVPCTKIISWKLRSYLVRHVDSDDTGRRLSLKLEA